jgi:hypothetical protein
MKVRFEATFLLKALEQESPIRKGLSKAVKLMESMTFGELLGHQGLHPEKLRDQTDPATGRPLYSLRVTQSARIKAILDGETLVLLTIEPDHGKAYH